MISLLINYNPKIKTIEKPICSFVNSNTWKKSKLYVGYSTNGEITLYLVKGNKTKEIPNIQNLIIDEGVKNTFKFITDCNPFVMVDAKSWSLVNSGYFGE